MHSGEPITIVHTDTGMCLTTRQFDDWRNVQAAFEDYETSLGPFAVDELLEYLQIEYPNSQPFGRGDVLRLASRSNAFIWAAIESPPEGDGLKLGTTDGDSLRLAIDGYQFPDAEDPEKRFSWYMVEGCATRDGRAWDFRSQALTCDVAPLICGWLFELANRGERNVGTESPRPPWLIEPNLQFPSVSWENGRALLTIDLDLEFLPPDVRQSRRGAGTPEVLRVRATADDLRRAAVDFAATIARFPVAPGPSRPVPG
ncbi:MAG: hypothetical protein GY926_24560 [bacterium]|nr:hypothetical protein [bacterium]